MKKYLLLLLTSFFVITQSSYANNDNNAAKRINARKQVLIKKYSAFRNYVDNLKIQKKNVYANNDDSIVRHRLPKNTTECVEAGNFYNIRITNKIYKELKENYYNLPKKVDLNECSLKNIK